MREEVDSSASSMRAAGGSTGSSEALAYRLRRVALQSAVGGMLLSGIGMALAPALV